MSFCYLWAVQIGKKKRLAFFLILGRTTEDSQGKELGNKSHPQIRKAEGMT